MYIVSLIHRKSSLTLADILELLSSELRIVCPDKYKRALVCGFVTTFFSELSKVNFPYGYCHLYYIKLSRYFKIHQWKLVLFMWFNDCSFCLSFVFQTPVVCLKLTWIVKYQYGRQPYFFYIEPLSNIGYWSNSKTIKMLYCYNTEYTTKNLPHLTVIGWG